MAFGFIFITMEQPYLQQLLQELVQRSNSTTPAAKTTKPATPVLLSTTDIADYSLLVELWEGLPFVQAIDPTERAYSLLQAVEPSYQVKLLKLLDLQQIRGVYGVQYFLDFLRERFDISAAERGEKLFTEFESLAPEAGETVRAYLNRFKPISDELRKIDVEKLVAWRLMKTLQLDAITRVNISSRVEDMKDSGASMTELELTENLILTTLGSDTAPSADTGTGFVGRAQQAPSRILKQYHHIKRRGDKSYIQLGSEDYTVEALPGGLYKLEHTFRAAKGGGKGRGKSKGKGSKGSLTRDQCRICGETGHWGNECPNSSETFMAQSTSGWQQVFADLD